MLVLSGAILLIYKSKSDGVKLLVCVFVLPSLIKIWPLTLAVAEL